MTLKKKVEEDKWKQTEEEEKNRAIIIIQRDVGLEETQLRRGYKLCLRNQKKEDGKHWLEENTVPQHDPPPRESLTFSLPSIKTTLCRGVHPCVRSYICTVVSLLSCLLLASFVVFILPSLCSPCVTAESGETSNYTAQRVLSPSRVQRWRRPTQQPGGTDTDTQNICTVHFAQLPQVEEEEEEKTSQQSKYRDVDLCCHWPLCVFHSAGTIYQGFANCFLCLIICSGSAGSLTSRWRPISCAHVSLSLKTTLCASLSSCQSTTAQFIIT